MKNNQMLTFVAGWGCRMCRAVLLFLVLGGPAVRGDEAPDPSWRVAVLTGEGSGHPERSARLGDLLEQAGFTVERASAQTLADLSVLNAARMNCLVLPHAGILPNEIIPALLRFLEQGGDVVLMGGKAFQQAPVWVDGKRLPAPEARDILAARSAGTPLFDLSSLEPREWTRNTDHGEAPSRLTVEAGEASATMRMEIRGFRNYDTFRSSLPKDISPAADTLVFEVRSASENTREMTVEFAGPEESRWIATIPVSPEWQTVTLGTADFVRHGQWLTPVELQQRFSFSDATHFAVGLAREYTRQTGPDHTLWLREIGMTTTGIHERTPLLDLPVYTDLPPFQYMQASEAVPVLDGSPLAPIPGPLKGTAAFAVPRGDESQLYPLLKTRGTEFPLTAGSVLAHYNGRFADSQWMMFGMESDSAYTHPAFEAILVAALKQMQTGEWVRRARETNPMAGGLDQVVGITHHAGAYHFTDQDFLNEGVKVIQDLGTRTLKLWLEKPLESYPFNTEWPEVNSMKELADTPYFRKAFSAPFDVIYFEAFAVQATWWPRFREGLTPEQAAIIEEEFYELTCYMLTEYRDSGKTFVMQNWEGDWALRPKMDRNLDPDPKAVQGMIDWLNARQAGVDRARNDVGEHGVKIYHAAEMNLVLPSMLGRDGVVNRVLPFTNVDFASYSKYEVRGVPKLYRAALEYMQMNLPPSDHVQGNRVVVGEFGVPETQMGEANVKMLLPESVEIATAFGSPHLLYWQLYCNEVINKDATRPVTANDDVNGFWLIRPDGSRSWAWTYFEGLFRR